MLGPTDVRGLAAQLSLRPTKSLGQNFVIDPGTVRRVAALALANSPASSPSASQPATLPQVVEVGPGLGSLTLALLEAGASVTAIEIDAILARQLPQTVADRLPQQAEHLTVLQADAMTVDALAIPGGSTPTIMAANLPYNIAVPVVLRVLERFASIQRIVVMVQAEVADRLAAEPGSRVYGIPSAKRAFYATARRAGNVSRSVFWPVPRVDSALVVLERQQARGNP
ncbi:MAG: 16S rRNA (adenine(1518)-N(6)/adenine(1519)-N(6))-dimethyltransferase RsmA, partial [Bifidobacteriaceae bacterium]|nr:16S rRNA (adenine(1518)-N(6)/adenine(1519)-N(6))-dimethyltransferase RsmA [Bifidobacteriaceae bacterium]